MKLHGDYGCSMIFMGFNWIECGFTLLLFDVAMDHFHQLSIYRWINHFLLFLEVVFVFADD